MWPVRVWEREGQRDTERERKKERKKDRKNKYRVAFLTHKVISILLRNPPYSILDSFPPTRYSFSLTLSFLPILPLSASMFDHPHFPFIRIAALSLMCLSAFTYACSVPAHLECVWPRPSKVIQKREIRSEHPISQPQCRLRFFQKTADRRPTLVCDLLVLVLRRILLAIRYYLLRTTGNIPSLLHSAPHRIVHTTHSLLRTYVLCTFLLCSRRTGKYQRKGTSIIIWRWERRKAEMHKPTT